MEPFLLFACGAILAIASIIDVKTREVPDFLNYSLIAIGLGVNTLIAIAISNIMIFLQSIAGMVFGFLLGWALYYLGQWGGGDSKLLIGLGAAIGIPFSTDFIKSGSMILSSFLVSMLANMIIVGAIYALFIAVFLAATNWDKMKEPLERLAKKSSRWRIPLQIIILVCIIASAIFFRGFERIMIVSLLLICAVFSHLWIFIKAVEESAMRKWVAPDKLVEGDWVAEPVKIGRKTIVSPKDPGISKEQIKELKKAFEKGKKVLVKEGIPFVPTFFFSFLITAAFGNLILRFILA
ncbi:MAG: prepilin peptidase [Nanoarchaeota archaeon]|nr:MAG: prepilin peptidase [Nanoarchaeota archaeon]